MRDAAELLDFLTQKMTMMTVYQPAIILHLLTRDGVASRTELARMLSGYDEVALSFWDRVLMDNPKRWLVGKYQILNYDKDTQNFSLNFNLTNAEVLQQASAICTDKMTSWIQKESQAGKIEEEEVLRLYRVLEIARRGDRYTIPELEIRVEEFGMQVAVDELIRRYPGSKVTQQAYNNPGFNILVGTSIDPIAYANVKTTEAQQPMFYLSEGERQFSIDHAERFILLVVYAIHLGTEQYQLICREGKICASKIELVPMQWKARLLLG
jgi:hypothetical protein